MAVSLPGRSLLHRLELDLGTDGAVLDQGNSHTLANDGSIIYAGVHVLVRVLEGTEASVPGGGQVAAAPRSPGICLLPIVCMPGALILAYVGLRFYRRRSRPA